MDDQCFWVTYFCWIWYGLRWALQLPPFLYISRSVLSPLFHSPEIIQNCTAFLAPSPCPFLRRLWQDNTQTSKRSPSGHRTWTFQGSWGDLRTWWVDLDYVFTSSHMSTPINSWYGTKNMHLHSLMFIKHLCRVYRTTSKYCIIMTRRILNNTMPSMITCDLQSQIFWCSTSAWNSCYRDDIFSPKTSDALRAPICIFIQASFLLTPKNWSCSMMTHWTWPFKYPASRLVVILCRATPILVTA